MYFGTKPYDLEGYIEHRGDGSNMYRGENFGQPRTLVPGDVLANGLEVARKSTDEGNGGVGIHLTDETRRVVGSRIPLLLDGGENGKYPLDLEVGDIFETGCVVLEPPKEIDAEDPRFVRNREEINITITGGLRGHSFGVPKDLVVALHSETYPPSPDTRFGAYVIDNTLAMGARARRNLPQYGRLDGQSELDRVTDISNNISVLRLAAQTEKASYDSTIGLLREQCKQLKGVELLITGRLHGRSGAIVRKDNPQSWVENMLVEITNASVKEDTRHTNPVVKQHLPFIEIVGRTIENEELVSAWIDVGGFGVTAVFPSSQPESQTQ